MPFNQQGEWRPNRKQEKFLCLPTSIKEGFYGGGAGSGKSEILLVYPLVRKWYNNSRFKQVFMRRTYVELRNEILPRSREFYPKFGATFNKSEMSWCFPREDQYGSGMLNAGAMIYLSHCENEDDVHNFDSMEINLFTPDELTSFTEWQYLYIAFERVRAAKDSGLPAVVRAAGMPGGIGHSWVKKRLVDPCKEGGKIIVGKGNNKRIYIHATQSDNENIDPNYAQSLAALPEAEKRAKLYGDWDAYLGQVFEEFRDRKYHDEPDNALHVIEPFDIPTWWPRIVVIDWGFAAMNYVTYSAISPDRRVYTYREQGWTKTKIEEWAPYVKEYIDIEHPRVVKMCKSASQERGQDHTILQQVSEALDCNIELSVNSAGSRISGKALIHEYLRWQQKRLIKTEKRIYNEEYAQWILRNRNLNEYKSYLASFNGIEPESNLPKWQIFNNCPILVNAIKACSYAKAVNGIAPEDVAQFDGDDPYDNTRYLMDTVDRFFDEAKDEFDKVQKEDELVQKLSNDGDWTAFYRNSRTLESTNKVIVAHRYHH